MLLSVIIPVYNEENTLEAIVARVRATGLAHEIVVVDDGSSDGSWTILEQIQNSGEPRLEILRHSRNLGKGTAVRSALTVVTGDVVLIQDADLEYDPADYRLLLRPFEDPTVQVVYGSRILRRNPRSSFAFYWGGRLLSWLTNRLYGSHISDESTGYKVFRADLIKELDLQENGFGFCSEATAKILRDNIIIHEVPVSYSPRNWSQGKKIRWHDGACAAWNLLRFRLASRREAGNVRTGIR